VSEPTANDRRRQEASSAYRADEAVLASDIEPDTDEPDTDELDTDELGDDLSGVQDDQLAEQAQAAAVESDLDQTQALVAAVTADLQRVHAEYANYRKRVERDRDLVRDSAVAGALGELLPVLDDVGRAREHGELEGAFKSVGEALEATVARLGLESFGTVGEPFDPTVHEALTHVHSDDVAEATCVAVYQPGYRFAGRVVRAARVGVADPG
jgi:molecular chaperone GrpE